MRRTIVDRVWLFITACLVCALTVVITLSGAVPALVSFLGGNRVDSRLFGVLISCNDLGNVFYLDSKWLLQTIDPATSLSESREATFHPDPLAQLTRKFPPVNRSIFDDVESSHSKPASHIAPTVVDETAFLRLVWQSEDSVTDIDLTRLYSLGFDLDQKAATVDVDLMVHYSCPATSDSVEAFNVSHLMEMRVPYDWDPGGKPTTVGNETIYQVDAEDFRRVTCVDGTSRWSLRMSDEEWCSNLSMVPGYQRDVQFIEPLGLHSVVKVNVTGKSAYTPPQPKLNCHRKPPRLNDRSSYYDSPFSSSDVSLQPFLVETGQTNATGILLSRSALTRNGQRPSAYSITLLYMCYAASGDPSVLGSTLLLDFDTRLPLRVPGGARYITIWNQTNPVDDTVSRHIAYLTSCGDDTQSLVVGQLIPGPVMYIGACAGNIYLPRSYYVKVLRQIPLTTGCVDAQHNYQCALQCQQIYDFSVRLGHVGVDDEKWTPSDGSFYIVTLTVCSAGLRFDRLQLPFLKLETLNDPVPSLSIYTRFVSTQQIDPSTRIQFDNFNKPGETPQNVDSIWHSQVTQIKTGVDSGLVRPYREVCGYSDRGVLWRLELEKLLGDRACLRRWLDAPQRLPYLLRSISADAIVSPVRNYGIFMFNVSCSYCSLDTHPILKIPRKERLLASQLDGICGDAHAVNMSPVQVAGDLMNPQIIYYWDASNNSLRWIRVRGPTDKDWDVIHLPSTLFVPKFLDDAAPNSYTWSTDSSDTKRVIGAHYSRGVLSLVDTDEDSCSLTYDVIGQTRSPIGATFASPRADLLIWSEPIREAAFIAEKSRLFKQKLQGRSTPTWRRLASVNGKVFAAIAYSDRKQQIFLSAPEEGSIYSVGLGSENYNLVFRASDRLVVGDILKGLRPNEMYIDPTSDAVYFTALPVVNITSYYMPSWGNASAYDDMFYKRGIYGWARVVEEDVMDFAQQTTSMNGRSGNGWVQPSMPIGSAGMKQVNPGPNNMANSIWILRPNFAVRTLMTEPTPYYTNPAAHITAISGHDKFIIALERSIANRQVNCFRVIKIPVMHFSPEIFNNIIPLTPEDAEVLIGWTVLNANALLAPYMESGFFTHGHNATKGRVNRNLFGWIAFGILMVHLCLATGYNFKMWRREFMTSKK